MTEATGAVPRSAGSAAYYSAIAPGYDATYATPSHRLVYDGLARDYVSGIALRPGALVVDVGCGSGRWLPYWFSRGCTVIGIENAPGMIERLREREADGAFTHLAVPMERAEVPAASADLVVALGSVQYAGDPAAMFRRFHDWLRPGGTVCVYVDSLVALVLELHASGRHGDATALLAGRRGTLRSGDASASMRLFDRAALAEVLLAAGFDTPRCHGLAVGATVFGRDGLAERLLADQADAMARERVLADQPALVDLGLHVLAIAHRPSA